MIDFVGPLLALKYSKETVNKIKQTVCLIVNGQNQEAIRILDTIGARDNPQFGYEIISASVFYYKGMAESNLGNNTSARFYLDIVEKIPTWRVVTGRQTLKDIKEEARKLKFKL